MIARNVYSNCHESKILLYVLFLDGIILERTFSIMPQFTFWLCQVKVASKPQTLWFAPSYHYVKMIMYRLFTFQKLRGHSKTTWTKKGTNVPGTSVGNISKVKFCPRLCLKMSLYGYATSMQVVKEDPKYCSRRIWMPPYLHCSPNLTTNSKSRFIISEYMNDKNEIRNLLSNPVNKIVPYIIKFLYRTIWFILCKYLSL